MGPRYMSAGAFYGTIQFNSAAGSGGSSASVTMGVAENGAFLAQLNGSGAYQWNDAIYASGSSTAADAQIAALAVDSSGNVFAAATYDSYNAGSGGSTYTATFYPNSGSSFALPQTPITDGNQQGFIFEATSNGAVNWKAYVTDQQGTFNTVNAIAIDSSDNVYVRWAISRYQIYQRQRQLDDGQHWATIPSGIIWRSLIQAETSSGK